MKRLLLLEIDCGDVVCTNKCDWYDSKGEACSMFDVRLVDGMVRHFQCTGAEERAKNIINEIHARYEATPALKRRTD